MLKKSVIFTVLICVLAALTGCTGGSNKTGGEESKGKVVFADGDWDSIRLHNAIAAFILENGYGYETELLPGSSENLLQGQIEGDVDIYMEQWPDNMQAYKPAVEDGSIVEVGINFDDNKQGLYVPRYVIEGDTERNIEAVAPDLKTIEDLKKYADLFKDPEDPEKGRIVNGPATYAATKIMEKKFENYNLGSEYNLVSSGSSSGLSASLSGAYEKGKPWVGYYWEPTWISGKYDLVLLEEAPYSEELWNDNYKCEFKSVECTITVSKNFYDNNSEAIEFLSNYKTSSSLISEILAHMQETGADIDETAKWFLKEKTDVWKSWVSEEVYTKVKNQL